MKNNSRSLQILVVIGAALAPNPASAQELAGESDAELSEILRTGQPKTVEAGPLAADVSSRGNFQYSRSIFAPEGRNGLTPKISSTMTPGRATVGWALAGL